MGECSGKFRWEIGLNKQYASCPQQRVANLPPALSRNLVLSNQTHQANCPQSHPNLNQHTHVYPGERGRSECHQNEPTHHTNHTTQYNRFVTSPPSAADSDFEDRRYPIPQTCAESVRYPPDKRFRNTQIQHLLKRRPLDIILNETDGAQIEVPYKISTKRGRWLQPCALSANHLTMCSGLSNSTTDPRYTCLETCSPVAL